MLCVSSDNLLRYQMVMPYVLAILCLMTCDGDTEKPDIITYALAGIYVMKPDVYL